jgi:hypothetical protein
MRTFRPPSPSTTRPECVSTTLAWKRAPRSESNRVPLKPAAVKATVYETFCDKSQSLQNGTMSVDVAEIIKDPSRPAPRPIAVTPPFVPGGTTRHGAVMRRGFDLERMPNSDEKVSAATAA